MSPYLAPDLGLSAARPPLKLSSRSVSTLDEYIYDRLRAALDTIPSGDRADIYVVSVFVYDEDDDPRRPTITVGFNTETFAGSGDDEDRWNYAMYPQNELAVLFDSIRDPDGAGVRRQAISRVAYEFPGDDSTARQVTTPWFVANTVFAARRLHDAGDIERICGRSIPVIVHELEYYDTIAMQNLAANPPGVADHFIR